ncbi:MAG TPA: hypothetical protein VMW47_02530 [Verrucomicrobiae bacterium]|nr:hypothetical protein [Verrucomicrobiae bacterium]
MSRLRRLIRALAAPRFARHPPVRLHLAPEVLGGLIAMVALVAAVGNAAALAAVLAGLAHPGALGGWLPALATLVGAALGLSADLCIGLGGWILGRRPRLGSELVVTGLLQALAATLVLGVAGGSLLLTLLYLLCLLAVYALVTLTAARALRPPPGGAGPASQPVPTRAPVPWILPSESRQPAAWRPPGSAALAPPPAPPHRSGDPS